MTAWKIIENIVTLVLACGMTWAFFSTTGSLFAFVWLLLLLNLNFRY